MLTKIITKMTLKKQSGTMELKILETSASAIPVALMIIYSIVSNQKIQIFAIQALINKWIKCVLTRAIVKKRTQQVQVVYAITLQMFPWTLKKTIAKESLHFHSHKEVGSLSCLVHWSKIQTKVRNSFTNLLLKASLRIKPTTERPQMMPNMVHPSVVLLTINK